MATKQFITDKGLLLKKKEFDFSLPDSFESILAIQKAISAFRANAQPDQPSWNEYILQFFQKMGFRTDPQDSRLITLSGTGGHSPSKTLLLLLFQTENFDEIIPGLRWQSYLFYAGHFHNAHWGIITNGLEIRLYDLTRPDYQDTFLWINLDGVVKEGHLEQLFTVYKVFSYIRGYMGQTISSQRKERKSSQKADQEPRGEYSLSYHIDDLPKDILKVFEALRKRILGLSDSVSESPKKKIVNYIERGTFCSVHFQKNQIKLWVPQKINQISGTTVPLRDVSNIGHYGTGDTEMTLQSLADVDAVFDVIRQAYEGQ